MDGYLGLGIVVLTVISASYIVLSKIIAAIEEKHVGPKFETSSNTIVQMVTRVLNEKTDLSKPPMNVSTLLA